MKDLSDGAGLPGVNVILKGTTSGTSTDADGRFEFPERLKEGDVLVFTFIGYKSQELTINKKSIGGLAVPLELCMDVDIMGEVSVEAIFIDDPPIVQRWMQRIKTLF